MQLRTNVRLPGRYREEDVPELPPNPVFVVPTTPYNPNLRPAVFPTLSLDQDPPDCHHSAEEETPNYKTGTPLPGERHALVFRDQRLPKKMPEHRNLIADEDPGEYDGYNAANWNEDENKPTELWHPSAFSDHVYFNDLSKGTQLIIMRELTNEMSFRSAVKFLCLEESELDDFTSLCQAEITRNKNEDIQIARASDRQLSLLMSSNWTQGHDEWSAILEEELYSGLDKQPVPATFSISRSDIEMARKYLVDFRVREEFANANLAPFNNINNIPTFSNLQAIVRRLEGYDGIDTSWNDLNFGDGFLDYFHPEEDLVNEGTSSRSEIEHLRTLFRDDLVYMEPILAPITQPPQKRPSGRRAATKNGDTIAVELIPSPKRSRHPNPRRAVLKAPPSRLREVFTAADLDAASQSSATNRKRSLEMMISSPGLLVDSNLRRDSGAATPRRILSLSRNPFQEHIPSNLSSPPSYPLAASHQPQTDRSVPNTSPAFKLSLTPDFNPTLPLKTATSIKLTIKRAIELSSPIYQPPDSKPTRSEATRPVPTLIASADNGNDHETSTPANSIAGSVISCAVASWSPVFNRSNGAPRATAHPADCSTVLENSKAATQFELATGTQSVITAYGVAHSQNSTAFPNPTLVNPAGAIDNPTEELATKLAKTTPPDQIINHSVLNNCDIDYNSGRAEQKRQMVPAPAIDQISNSSPVNHLDTADIIRREEGKTHMAFAATIGQIELVASADRKRRLAIDAVKTSATKRRKIFEKSSPGSAKVHRPEKLRLTEDTPPAQSRPEYTSAYASQASDSAPMTALIEANVTDKSQLKTRKTSVTKEQGATAASPAMLHEVAASDESKRLGARPQILAEKTRSAAKSARMPHHQIPPGVESTLLTSPSSESIVAGNIAGHRGSRVQVLIPKRTASELSAHPSTEGGSSKKSRTAEATPLGSAAFPPVSEVSLLKLQKKKAAPQRRVKKAASAKR